MTKILKWLIVLIFPLFSLAVTSCDSEDGKDEPIPPGTPGVSDAVVNIEDIIVGTWESTPDSFGYVHVITFKENNIYYRPDKEHWWEKGDYIIADNKIVFTPISDWTGSEYDLEYSIKNYRFTWQVEYKNGHLIVTDEDGDTFTMSKTPNEPVYAHEIVGTWSLADEDYVETLLFDVDGKFRREVYINQRLYAWQAGSYSLERGKSVIIQITSSDSNTEYSEEVYTYNIGGNGLTLYNYDGEVGTFKRVN